MGEGRRVNNQQLTGKHRFGFYNSFTFKMSIPEIIKRTYGSTAIAGCTKVLHRVGGDNYKSPQHSKSAVRNKGRRQRLGELGLPVEGNGSNAKKEPPVPAEILIS